MSKLQLVSRRIANSMRRLSVLALAASWLAVPSSAVYAFDLVAITENDTDDRDPDISGSNVVWEQGIGDGNVDEILFWDGASTTQLTNDSIRDQRPALYGSKLVWQRWDWDEYEIYTSTLTLIDPVPTISLRGLALLAALVLGVVAWARRCR